MQQFRDYGMLLRTAQATEKIFDCRSIIQVEKGRIFAFATSRCSKSSNKFLFKKTEF